MIGLIDKLLIFLEIAIFIKVILSFVIGFSGGRPHPTVVAINQTVTQVTEPLLGPIRRVLPAFGGLDFSPMVLIIVIELIRGQVLH